MTVLEDLRIEAGLSIAQLAKLARVARETIEKAERDEPIRGDVAGKICRALSQQLGRQITYKEAQITIL